ncbi:MAG: hypothetical protein Q8P89_02650 [bacterium]|nr:hypothetical protein [bacterium]
MLQLDRSKDNPILTPNSQHEWERDGTFNGCAIKGGGKFHIVYRALSSPQSFRGFDMRVSSIGYSQSDDEVHFRDHQILIRPTEDWEIFGCEDPRITCLEGQYFIFYTALSTYPFSAEGIKIGLAITHDLQNIEKKHPVTTFNSKAMALFPERINGKIIAILTVDTDRPPAKIALAVFDKEEDIWSKDYWESWYQSLNTHIIPLLQDARDQVEVGTPPLKTEAGWLLIYSYIQNYFSPERTFGIKAVLLDKNDPQKIIGRTEEPILVPDKDYELFGNVPNVIFPSGAVIEDDKLLLYYGAADTTCCLATCKLNDLLDQITKHEPTWHTLPPSEEKKFKRFNGNPIITSIPELTWQGRATFNPAAIYEGGKTHLVYRAMSPDNTSTLGYASSDDGFNITERLPYPIYVPREEFEKKTKPYGNSGCEDPRLTRIGEKIYMCYTAFDGTNPPEVAFSSISLDDFLNKHWEWGKPQIISPPGAEDKDACLFPEKIGGKYVFLHRIGFSMWIDFVTDLHFKEAQRLGGEVLINPRKGWWDNFKVGVAAPPLKTKAGWLVLYHGVSEPEIKYRLGALLLDLNNPAKIIARTDHSLFDPEMPYETTGEVPNVVFPCGAVILGKDVFIYYGGGDKVVGTATMPLDLILENLLG